MIDSYPVSHDSITSMSGMRIKHGPSNESGKVPKDEGELRECVLAPLNARCVDLNGTRQSTRVSADCAAMPAIWQARFDRFPLMAHEMLRSSRVDGVQQTVSCIIENGASSMVMPRLAPNWPTRLGPSIACANISGRALSINSL